MVGGLFLPPLACPNVRRGAVIASNPLLNQSAGSLKGSTLTSHSLVQGRGAFALAHLDFGGQMPHADAGGQAERRLTGRGYSLTTLPRSIPMKPQLTLVATFLLLMAETSAFVAAQQPITLNDVPEGLPVIAADEPKAGRFSPEKAAEYLDRSALNWQKTKKCATCHTNLFYMAARPALAKVQPDSGEVRGFYEDYRKVRWQTKGPTEGAGLLARRCRHGTDAE